MLLPAALEVGCPSLRHQQVWGPVTAPSSWLTSISLWLCLSPGGPDHFRLPDLHRREAQGPEPRGGAEKVGGGADGLPGEGRLRPHSGKAGPLPALTAPFG